MLKAIGYFIEELYDNELPAPQELVVRRHSPQLEIADYLDSGLKYVQWRGLSWCRFGCGIDSRNMGSRDLTDGIWVWPEGLSHYVRDHSISLPPEFCGHALDKDEQHFLPADKVEYDYSVWNSWTVQFRNAELRSRLDQARKDIIPRAEAERERSIKEFTAIRGEGENICEYRDCEAKALSSKTLCGRHSFLFRSWKGWLERYSYQRLAEVLTEYSNDVQCIDVDVCE